MAWSLKTSNNFVICGQKHKVWVLVFLERAEHFETQRTSDGGNGNHSVSLPIILIKIKVDQMIPSSYKSSLLVSIL